MKLLISTLIIYCTSLFAFEQSFVLHGQKTAPLWSIQLKDQVKPISVKIKALASPKKGTLDTLGNVCEFIPVGHKKILVEMGIKDINTGLYYDRTILDNIAINEESLEKNLKIIPGNRDMTLDIISVSWDYTCSYHTENTKGFDQFHHSYPQYCPWDLVWPDDCIAFKLNYH